MILETVRVVGQTLIMFRLASGDCKEMMAARVDIVPDLDGLVLGTDWYRENRCAWNTTTGRVHAIDDIVFHAHYDRNASLVDRVSQQPVIPASIGSVSSVELEQLLPIRVLSVIESEEVRPVEGLSEAEPEPKLPVSVGMVQGSPESDEEGADPQSTPSWTASSQSEPEYEYESEQSDGGRGEFGQPDSTRESISVPVPTTQLE